MEKELKKENIHDKLRKEAWDKSLHTFAASYLYSIRQTELRKKLSYITYLGVLVPILIGAIATSYGTESQLLNYAIWVFAPISIIQLIISTWSLVAKWNDASEYYTESTIANSNLSNEYKELAGFPPKKSKELKNEIEKINIKNTQREQQDNKYPLSEKEKRRGMRFGLREFQRKCVSCKIVPVSMETTDCPVCGNF